MNLDDILGALTLLFCVGAVFLARRGARRKMGEAYARGARDVSARSQSSVVVGDVVFNRGSGTAGASSARGLSALSTGDDDNDDGSGDDDHNRPPIYDHDHNHIGRIAMRRTGIGDGMGDVRDLGVGTAIGQLSSHGVMVDRPAARRTTRVVRSARVTELTELEAGQ